MIIYPWNSRSTGYVSESKGPGLNESRFVNSHYIVAVVGGHGRSQVGCSFFCTGRRMICAYMCVFLLYHTAHTSLNSWNNNFCRLYLQYHTHLGSSPAPITLDNTFIFCCMSSHLFCTPVVPTVLHLRICKIILVATDKAYHFFITGWAVCLHELSRLGLRRQPFPFG